MAAPSRQRTDRRFPRLSQLGHVHYGVIQNPRERLAACGVPEEQFQNICGSGIRFQTSEAVAPDTFLAVRIELPHLPDTILALGRVVSCDVAVEEAARWELAVEFFWTGWGNGAVDTALHEFLSRRVAAPMTAQKKPA